MMMRHLLWKDVMTIKPLVGAILCGIIAIYAVLTLSVIATNDRGADLFVSFWFLMPNLVALGGPAILVGSEEESGTLAWLRTLPVKWQTIADSKFVVAAGALVLTWSVSSLLLWATRVMLRVHDTTYSTSMLTLDSIAYLLLFSLLLLICGFITAYLFRSPIGGLLAVVPTIGLVNLCSLDAARWVLTGDVRDKGLTAVLRYEQYALIGALSCVLLVLLYVTQKMLARRRLVSPKANLVSRFEPQAAIDAYQPPVAVGTNRPSLTRALLWQQSCQMGWLGALLTVIIGGSALLHLGGDRVSRNLSFIFDISPFLVAIGGSWLGGLAFYGDNVRRRCAFFADRGARPWDIWWTRMALPSVLCVLVVAMIMLQSLGSGQNRLTLSALIVFAFSFGQLIGQWMQRPVMTFFVAPGYAAAAGSVLVVLYTLYPTYLWTMVLVAPLLAVASWQLSERWLLGRMDKGYNGRAIVYTLAAIACPFVFVLCQRYSTIPDLDPQWRRETFAIQLPGTVETASAATVGLYANALSPGGASVVFSGSDREQILERLEKKRASDQIGEFATNDDLSTLFDRDRDADFQLQMAAIEVSLKWASVVRKNVVEGRNSLWDLEQIAEWQEYGAVGRALERLMKSASFRRSRDTFGFSPDLSELVAAIPSRELRRKSRRFGLIRQWRHYQSQSWRHTDANGYTAYYKDFMRHPVAQRVAMIPFERTRSDRMVDQATKLTLQQLDRGLPPNHNSAAYIERMRLWSEAHRPRADGALSHPGFGSRWTEDYERRIDSLREMVR